MFDTFKLSITDLPFSLHVSETGNVEVTVASPVNPCLTFAICSFLSIFIAPHFVIPQLFSARYLTVVCLYALSHFA